MQSSVTKTLCQATDTNRGGAPAADPHCDRLEFGSFSLVPSQRLLLHDGEPVHIGARAFDVLIALAARPGELVTREELTAQVWPNTFVDAVNLRVHVAALRKALGDDHGRLIHTDPGRGYRLTAPIRPVMPAPLYLHPPAVSYPPGSRALLDAMTSSLVWLQGCRNAGWSPLLVLEGLVRPESPLPAPRHSLDRIATAFASST